MSKYADKNEENVISMFYRQSLPESDIPNLNMFSQASIPASSINLSARFKSMRDSKDLLPVYNGEMLNRLEKEYHQRHNSIDCT